MSWYNDENWYAPNYEAESKEDKSPERKAKAIEGSKKARIIALIVTALIVIGSVVLAIVLDKDTEPEGKFDPELGFMPSDWHEIFNDIDLSDSVVETDIPEYEGDVDVSISLSDGVSGSELSYTDIYDSVVPSVVGIKCFEDGSPAYSWGTGIIISDDGYIITNAHVIADSDSAKVILYEGDSFDARLVGADAATDIALLKIDAEGLTPAKFATASSLKVGNTAIAIGNPLSENYSYTMTDGIISAVRREVSHNGHLMSLIQTNAAINGGNSGGPLINSRGEVIGITNMKMVYVYTSQAEGLGFAIPSDTVKSFLGSLGGSDDTEPILGITVSQIAEQISDYYGLPHGLYVAKVNEKSDAQKQGMREGDIITAVNGNEAITNSDVSEARDATAVGDTIRFTIWRDGKTLELDVKVMQMKDLK